MGLKSYAKGVVREGKRVRWPHRDTLIPAIIVVLVIAIIAALILFFEDWLGNSLLEAIKNAFGIL
ncbi:MAG: preprotein translocase subunit SecE [Coprobacillus sp.]|nr:preprotein translocase subunit SecE [Coprobacillus sp.]